MYRVGVIDYMGRVTCAQAFLQLKLNFNFAQYFNFNTSHSEQHAHTYSIHYYFTCTRIKSSIISRVHAKQNIYYFTCRMSR